MRDLEKRDQNTKHCNLPFFYLLSLNPKDIGHLTEQNSLSHDIFGTRRRILIKQ